MVAKSVKPAVLGRLGLYKARDARPSVQPHDLLGLRRSFLAILLGDAGQFQTTLVLPAVSHRNSTTSCNHFILSTFALIFSR
jgi:hypothetical protein